MHPRPRPPHTGSGTDRHSGAAPEHSISPPCRASRLARAAAASGLLLLLPGLAGPPPARAAGAPRVTLVSPAPGASLVQPGTTLLVRVSEPLDAAAFDPADLFVVEGARSGRHAGSAVLSDDRLAVVFKPDEPFVPGEAVTVSLRRGLRVTGGAQVAAPGTRFTVGRPAVRDLAAGGGGWMAGIARRVGASLALAAPAGPLPVDSPSPSPDRTPLKHLSTDSLPAGFPKLYTQLDGTPAPGYIFAANVKFQGPDTTYLLITDNLGNPVACQRMSALCFDFKLQPNGLLTYYDATKEGFYALDAGFAVVDSFFCGNGYTADLHELRLTSDGHAWLFSYDPEAVDMSKVVPGGFQWATVTGLIIQELDSNKNVVFQWRSWDHFQITDATHENLTAQEVDYVHGNALDFDADGNLILSCRHMDEITKIDRATGNLLWRWGGKHNQFTFVNDTLGFSHQHAIRRIPNGDFTMFDNGNYHTPQFSRALEYQLDEQNHAATLVWQYVRNPAVYGEAMGYVQRLPDGNTLVSWGLATPALTEVTPDGTPVYEMWFNHDVYSYRAFRFEWSPGVTSVLVPPPAAARPVLGPGAPNPFRARATFSVNLPRSGNVGMGLYDLAGRRVKALADGQWMSAGSHAVSVDGAGLPTGVYLFRFTLDGSSWTRKVTVMH